MSNSHYGWQTSVDLLRQEQTSLSVGHGTKRVHGVISGQHEASREVHDDAKARLPSQHSIRQSLPKNRLSASVIRQDSGDELVAESGRCSDRRLLSTQPSSSSSPLLLLSNTCYGLPKTLVQNYAELGITTIYPWQASCLMGRGLLEGLKNLVYTAPTGGGKSLVADVLMAKRVIDDPSKKAILVLPYVALVQEKLKFLRKLVCNVKKRIVDEIEIGGRKNVGSHQSTSIHVAGFFGGSKIRTNWRDFDIAVCTIEKANGIVNGAIADGNIGDLGVVVLDELHMIDDDHRGYLLEIIASKLLSLESSVQIVGMSATLTNTELLARWLNAKFYNTKFAPIPIEAYLVHDNAIYSASSSSTHWKAASQLNSTEPLRDLKAIRSVQTSHFKELQSALTNSVVALAVETAVADYGALVFCSGRQSSQNMAELISEAMPIEGFSDEILSKRQDVVCELRSLSVGLDDVLGKTIPRGVAFHHAGLTAEERDIVAESYDKGIIRVIVATCSLAAGINLPARRVILQGARMGKDLVGPALLRQMRGRAGRKGKDDIGESYICCPKSDLEEVLQLIEADLPTLTSSLTPEKRGIQRALLEVIAVRLATHAAAVQEYIQRTLLYHTMDATSLKQLIETSMKSLLVSDLITIDQYGGYEATSLSKATVSAYLNPEDGLFLHGELRTALKAFVMDGEMHMFYTFTPIWNPGNVEVNWGVFRDEIDGLDESGMRVLHCVGVKPAVVNRLAQAGRALPEETPEEARIARIYRRLYTAFQLRDLCNEIPIHTVARKYKVPRGFIQTLAQICEGFAASMVQFCEHMGWGMLKAALEHMSDRLKAGARADLLELAQIPFVKSRTARTFHENGFRSVRIVAETEAKDLVPVLLLAQPKRSSIDGEEEAKYHQKLLLKADIIVSAANRLWERQQQVEVELDM